MRTRTWFGSVVVHSALTAVLGLLWVAQAPAEDEPVVIRTSCTRRPTIWCDPPRDIDINKHILDQQRSEDPIYLRGDDDGSDYDELDAAGGESVDAFVAATGGRRTPGIDARVPRSGGMYFGRTGRSRNLISRG
jgi:hypothetical protein